MPERRQVAPIAPTNHDRTHVARRCQQAREIGAVTRNAELASIHKAEDC
jgi:hypothetical protein